jgi:YVTN family beta-propeller protein
MSKFNRLQQRVDERPRSHLRSPQSFVLAAFFMLLFGLALSLVLPEATAAQPEPTPLPLYALPDARLNRMYASGSIALSNDALTMAAANSINNTVTLFVPSQSRVIAEVPVGLDPRGVTFTLDGLRALVTNRGDGTLAILGVNNPVVTGLVDLGGLWPYGVVIDERGTAYVSMQGSNEVVAINVDEARVTARIPTLAAPAGLLLWGDFLYVTHFWSGQISLIYLPQMRVVQTVSTGIDTGLFQALEPDVSRGIAYLPQTRSNAQNTILTHDTVVFPIVNVIDLRSLTLLRESRIALDIADRPVNMPFAAALDRFARRLYVANAGSNDVTVIDLDTGRARANIPVDTNPRGILLNRDNTQLYIHSALEGTITTVNTRSLEVIDVLPISNFNVSVDLLLGAQLFYNADDPRLTPNNRISCANCHFDGLSDGRVWAGFPDGPRNTPLLYRLNETSPYNWSATWDELADVELKIRDLMAGQGLIEGELPQNTDTQINITHAGLSLDLDLLTAYLTSLPPPPRSPYSFDAEILARGQAVFEEQGCAECHVGEAGTNLQSYEVDTARSPLEQRGTAFDTPSLRWLWLSAPYFHDGAASTLRQVFELPGQHRLTGIVEPGDIDALVSYLLTLPQGN